METTLLPVRVLKDFDVTIDGTAYSGRKGDTIELPRWVAAALEEVEFVGLTSTDVKKVLLEEEEPGLSKLPQNFYERAGGGATADRETRKVFMQLVDKRVEKVARAAAYDTVDRNIVHEERVLFSRLASAIRDWRRHMRKDILGENDEV